MGTTRDAIRAGHPHLGYVLVIEGYRYLITTGTPAQAIAAWAGTQWNSALTGLMVSGNFSQKMEPWSNELNIPTCSFSVVGDTATDQFAVDMFKSKPDVRSNLTAAFTSTAADGAGFNISVQQASQFSAGENIFIGNETFKVTGTPSGTTIPVVADGAGVFHPFGTNAGPSNTFPGPHGVPPLEAINSYETNSPVHVTNAPATWIGKKVGLYVHRIADGVWDLRDEAELIWAGTIEDIIEGDPGITTLSCVGIQQALADSEVMQDQWIGKMKEGYYFQSGDTISLRFVTNQLTYSAADFIAGTSANFTVGLHTASEFASLLAEHLDADSNIGAGGSDIALRWSATVTSTINGFRFQLKASKASTSVDGAIVMITSNAAILSAMGFTNIGKTDGTGRPEKHSQQDTGLEWYLVSEDAPYLYPNLVVQPRGFADVRSMEFEDSDGTFFDHTEYLPPSAQEFVDSGETWSFYSVGDELLFLARRDSATAISSVRSDIGIAGLVGKGKDLPGMRMGDGKSLRVKQVAFLTGTFQSIITKLFASIDGLGTNHTDHDVFPWGAAIPWSLLGNNFTRSLAALEQSGAEDSISIVIEKPMRLWDVIKSDFALRMAAPIWKEGGLQVAQLTVPNATTADFDFDEASKSDENRTVTETTKQFLVHTVKIKYNRDPLTDDYRDEYIARDKVAYENAAGAGKTKTIKARNSYAGALGSGSSVEALGDMLTARFLPVFSKPLKRWKRSLNHQQFHAAPGDTAKVTDLYVRNPATGIRGVTNRAATIMSVKSSLGIDSGGQEYFGEVELLYTEEDRLFPLAPSCEHAFGVTSGAYTAGYDASLDKILVHPHKFSDSDEDNDASHFAVGDAIRLTAMDPADPAAASTHTDTVASVTLDDITDYDAIGLTTGFTPTAGITYLVNYDAYDQCQADQLLTAFQSDDGDGLILDTIDPNLVGDTVKSTAAVVDITELPSRYSAEQYGDGEPLSASFLRDMARMANSLVNYKTAPHMPVMDPAFSEVNFAGTYQVMWVFPFHIGEGLWLGGRTRKLNVSLMYATGSGTDPVLARVTSSANPPKGDTYNDATWFGPKKHAVFSVDSPTNYTLTVSQELEVVRAADVPGCTWITVEGANNTLFKGVPEIWLGPFE